MLAVTFSTLQDMSPKIYWTPSMSLTMTRNCQWSNASDGNFTTTDPCGWCGREGLCITQLMPKGKKVVVISNCDYHFTKMQYMKASKFIPGNQKSVCTNVLLRCFICKRDGDGPFPTFWKYNFVHHMMTHHAGEDTSLPLVIIQTHISVEEGESYGYFSKINEIIPEDARFAQ